MNEAQNRRTQFTGGMRAGIPVILGFIPVGIAYAIIARQAGFSIAETCYMSLSVFAGASQMMAVGKYAEGASVIAIIFATFILNLRHIIMSVCVGRRMKGGGVIIRLIAGFGITDEGFAIFTTEKEENTSITFYIGLALVTYLSWNAGTLIGAVASDLLPAIITASLGVSLYAMFIGLLVPGLRGNMKLTLLVILCAVLNTILVQFLDSSLSLIISTLVCAAFGVFFVDLEGGNEH